MKYLCTGSQGMLRAAAILLGVLAHPVSAFDLQPITPVMPQLSRSTTASAPTVTMAAPSALARGQTYTLILNGRNFDRRVQVSFGEGIGNGTILSMTDSMLQVRVTVQPGAPLGPHPVVVIYGNQRQSGPVSVTVIDAGPTPGTNAGAPDGQPGLLAVPGRLVQSANLFSASPSQWRPGQSYLLSLGGLNLVSGMEVDFGDGIKPSGPVLVFNPGQAQVRIDVDASAKPGQRALRMRDNTGQSWRPTSAVGWVASAAISGVSSRKVRPNLAGIQPGIGFQKGVIELDKPDRYVDLDVGATKDTAFLLHDAVVFEWHEKNPGLADYYEFRILSPAGKVLITRRIERKLLGHYQAPPTYFQPDAAFLDALLNPVQGAGSASGAKAKSGRVGLQAGGANASPLAQTGSGGAAANVGLSDAAAAAAQGYPEGTELLWQVAGYHVYNSSGAVTAAGGDTWGEPVHVAAAQGASQISSDAMPQSTLPAAEQSKPVEIEVEVSERWPLKRPNRPNGFGACPIDGSQSLLSVENRDRGVDDTKVNAVNYPGDEMLLTGKIDLSASPYTSLPDETAYSAPYTPPPPGQSSGMPFINVDIPPNEVTDRRFDNLFVDWGDGTVVPLHLKAGGPNDAYGARFDRSIVMDLPDSQSYADFLNSGSSPYPEFFTHQYSSPRTYAIRVYQLSEGDVQNVNPALLNAAYGPLPSGGAGDIQASGSNPYFQIGRATGQLPSLPGKEIAGRAYVLYCHQLHVEPYKDPVANGALWLDKVEVVSFGAPKTSSSGTGAARGAKMARTGAAIAAAAKPGTAASVKPATRNLSATNAARAGIAGQLASDVDAVCSGCNKAFTAHAVLSYYGTGDIEAVWKVRLKSASGRVIAIPQTLAGSGRTEVPASPSREGNPKEWGDPIAGTFDLYSPPLPVDPAAVYEVWVEVKLAKDTFSGAAFQAMQSFRSGFAPATRQGPASGPAPKLGVLRPFNQASAGAPPVLYANTGQLVETAEKSGFAGMLAEKGQGSTGWKRILPESVTSDSKKYRVTAIDPSKPCQFYFPGQQGDRFPVYLDDQNIPQDSNGAYTGSGTLGLVLGGKSAGSNAEVGIDFQGWKVDQSGIVADGTVLKRQADRPVTATALTGTLSAIDAVAGQKMDVTLDLSVSNSLFRNQGSNDPVHWQATAPLRQNGDWIGHGKVGLAALGWTGFYLDSPDVVLDISKSEGDKPADCPGDAGAAWTGVHLGQANVEINTMDLVTVKVPVEGKWGIVDGVCGELDLVNDPRLINLTVGKGRVSFNRVHFVAGDKKMEADYSFSAHLPWLEVDLSGDNVPLLPEESAIEFKDVKPSGDVVRDFGPIRMDVPKDSFRFGYDAGGWRVIANPVMTFKAEGKNFLPAPLTVADMRFGMNGRAWFDKQAASTKEIPLSGTASLGKTEFDLNSVTLAGGGTADDRLAVSFHGTLNLSKALPAADVQVDYRISGDQYAGSGPFNAPFLVKTAFPPGQPSAEATIKPVYAPTPAQETRYFGAVDLGLFGGPPIKGEFLLGYLGSDDYWLTRVTVPLGDSGVPLYPPYLKLYQIRGGLGYNMALDAFKDAGTLENAQSSIGSGVMFMGGLRVGSYDQFAFTLDGDLTIAPKVGGGRMDFHAWLLKMQHTGNGDFQGFFQYAGGNFDGRLWGHLGMLNDAVAFDLGNSESNAAIDLHVGGGWYVYAGKREGPRIQAKVLTSGADSYLMLGSDVGLAVGGAQNYYLGVGSSSVASAYVKGYMDVGLQITPQPHAIGDFGAGAEAGVCVAGGCESMGVNAAVHAEALPIDMRAHATVEFPWPLPDVSFDVHM